MFLILFSSFSVYYFDPPPPPQPPTIFRLLFWFFYLLQTVCLLGQYRILRGIVPLTVTNTNKLCNTTHRYKTDGTIKRGPRTGWRRRVLSLGRPLPETNAPCRTGGKGGKQTPQPCNTKTSPHSSILYNSRKVFHKHLRPNRISLKAQ